MSATLYCRNGRILTTVILTIAIILLLLHTSQAEMQQQQQQQRQSLHTKLHIGLMSTGLIRFLLALLSAQRPVETSSSLAPDFAWVTVHSPSPVLRRGTICRLTFELHQHCLLLKIGLRLICFCSRIMYSHLNQLNSSGVCCTAPL